MSDHNPTPIFLAEIENAPKAIGPYSVASVYGSTIYCSGQIAINPETGKIVSEDFEAQVEQVLKNLSALLTHFKIQTKDILKATVFMTDLNNFPKFNALYGTWLGEAKPARSTIGVAALPAGAIVEVEIIAKTA
jgi:2-iminobutanoate/2-iminopropanoate deaminase